MSTKNGGANMEIWKLQRCFGFIRLITRVVPTMLRVSTRVKDAVRHHISTDNNDVHIRQY